LTSGFSLEILLPILQHGFLRALARLPLTRLQQDKRDQHHQEYKRDDRYTFHE